MHDQNTIRLSTLASYLFAALALLMILHQGLVGALFSGLLVYALVHMLAPLLEKKISGPRAKMIAVAALGIVVITALSLGIWGAISFFQSDAGNVHVLLQKLADIIEASRDQIPVWLREHLPDDAEALRKMIITWLREHSVEAKLLGEEAGRAAAHLLIGMIIGAMVALHDTEVNAPYLPLAAALCDRVANLSRSFQQIAFAQVRISAINTALTAIYLLILLPFTGITLPLSKSLIIITFVAGLLPVVGNLISNSVLVVVALSHSLHTAVISLLFMVIIHKFEYFLNARIIGSHIQARAWELLIAMLVMESLFGLSGLIAAPVLYAYIKKELMKHKLV